MKQCKMCGSMAINPDAHGRTRGDDIDLCDVCYWRKRAGDVGIQAAKRISELETKNEKLLREKMELLKMLQRMTMRISSETKWFERDREANALIARHKGGTK